MPSLTCLSSSSVSGVIMLIAIWLLQRGHVIIVSGEEGVLGLLAPPLCAAFLIKAPRYHQCLLTYLSGCS
jgi:hypothetical protein